MNKIMDQGLNDQQVKERIEKGQVNISKDNISKTKGQIVKEHTLTYFNGMNIFWLPLLFLLVILQI
ncbi:MAG: hypothetical protein LUG60_04320 [Erysipelotrichaceae bacterium]|nr:hypothetical protein [Erysipelotrichaceae bacterium]